MGIKDWNTQKSQSFTFGSSNSSTSSNSRKERQLINQQECIKLGKTKSCRRGYDHEGSRWKMLWMKIKKEKQRIITSNNNSSSANVGYDPEAYARNFDEGFERKDPEYLTRSFSARFADPSRIVHKNNRFQN